MRRVSASGVGMGMVGILMMGGGKVGSCERIEGKEGGGVDGVVYSLLAEEQGSGHSGVHSF